jgi:hypothetical protein
VRPGEETTRWSSSLAERRASRYVLCFDGPLTIVRITSRINGFTIEPGVDAFEEEDHQFKMCVSCIKMGVESTQEGLAPGGQFRAGTAKEMVLCIV